MEMLRDAGDGAMERARKHVLMARTDGALAHCVMYRRCSPYEIS